MAHNTQQQAALTWYLMVCLQLIVYSIAVFFDMHNIIWENDQTKLSFVTMAVWLVATALIGLWHRSSSPEQIRVKSKIGWYMAETCLAIGMVGTVAGFLLMLGAAFSDINVSDAASMQRALASMAVGMSTALYTTLIGLINSIFLKSQLVNLEYYADGLE
jgi:hypothetical protein